MVHWSKNKLGGEKVPIPVSKLLLVRTVAESSSLGGDAADSNTHVGTPDLETSSQGQDPIDAAAAVVDPVLEGAKPLFPTPPSTPPKQTPGADCASVSDLHASIAPASPQPQTRLQQEGGADDAIMTPDKTATLPSRLMPVASNALHIEDNFDAATSSGSGSDTDEPGHSLTKQTET